MPPSQLSGAAKKKRRKIDNQLIESQRGALNKYFPTTSSVDFNNNNKRRGSDPGQDNEHNSNSDLETNERSRKTVNITFLLCS